MSFIKCPFFESSLGNDNGRDVAAAMKQLNQTLNRKDAEKRIPIVRMEIDAELALLHRAMQQKEAETIKQCKEKLEELRREMILLEI